MSTGDRFCARCGAQIPQGAAFCSRCGASVSAETQGQPGPAAAAAPGYQGRRHEKQEKQEKQEKSEKGRGGDVTGPVTAGLVLIWLGLTFYLQENGYFPAGDWWAYFLMGMGAIFILQGGLRFVMNRRPFIGSFIAGAALVVIGFSFIQGVANLWPLILVVIGVAIMLSAFSARRRRPTP